MKRVHPCCKHLHCLLGCAVDRDGEADLCAAAAADPVSLLRADPLRPEVFEDVEVVEQRLLVGCDLEEPLLEQFLLDQGAGAPGVAGGRDLFVCEYGLVDGVPVDEGLGAVGEACGVEFEEEALRVRVVVGAAGREFLPPSITPSALVSGEEREEGKRGG